MFWLRGHTLAPCRGPTLAAMDVPTQDGGLLAVSTQAEATILVPKVVTGIVAMPKISTRLHHDATLERGVHPPALAVFWGRCKGVLAGIAACSAQGLRVQAEAGIGVFGRLHVCQDRG